MLQKQKPVISRIQIGDNPYTDENLPEEHRELLRCVKKIGAVKNNYIIIDKTPEYRSINYYPDKNLVSIRDYVPLTHSKGDVGSTTGRGDFLLKDNDGEKRLERVIHSNCSAKVYTYGDYLKGKGEL